VLRCGSIEFTPEKKNDFDVSWYETLLLSESIPQFKKEKTELIQSSWDYFLEKYKDFPMTDEDIIQVISRFLEEDILAQINTISAPRRIGNGGEIILQKHAKSIQEMEGKILCITKKECHINFTSSG
jgi:hypothetical protein